MTRPQAIDGERLLSLGSCPLDRAASFLACLAEVNRHVPHCGGQALEHALQEVVAAIQATPWRQWPVVRWQRRIDRAVHADGMPAPFGGNGGEKTRT